MHTSVCILAWLQKHRMLCTEIRYTHITLALAAVSLAAKACKEGKQVKKCNLRMKK